MRFFKIFGQFFADPDFSISSPITIDPILTALNRLLAILNIYFLFLKLWLSLVKPNSMSQTMTQHSDDWILQVQKVLDSSLHSSVVR